MTAAAPGQRRILFCADAVTLAHVARPLLLARALDATRYDIHFACAESYQSFLGQHDFHYWPLHSIPSAQFLQALATGARFHTEKTLTAYIDEDLSLLAQIRPDVVVGDMRLSLSISAARAGVTYATITNAHWSPYAVRDGYPLPEHPLTRLLGVAATRRLFGLIQPLVFAHHARPFNVLRRRYGLPPLGGLPQTYTQGDYTLYADVPELAPTANLPDHHRYIGPVVWSPDIAPPPWWDEVAEQPCIYVTLGSSGQVELLPTVVAALAALPVTLLVATAGRLPVAGLPASVRVAEYLPGSEAARRARLVICNGGSATVYQALAEGTPVLGIASNMDQHLTMTAVERAGVGRLLRAGQVTPARVVQTVRALLEQTSYQEQAQRLAAVFSHYDARRRFAEWADSVPELS